jgi:radical SAM protein
MFNSFDFSERPFLVIWETTHACDLACVHCRAQAEPAAAPDELTTEEGKKLIRDVKEMGTPILVFSGGDPLKRKDLPELIQYAKSLKLRTGAIPAVTPLLTEERILGLKAAGLDQIAFSLDAADPAVHDAFRRTEGVFERTLKSVEIAHRAGLSVQINSLINVHNTANMDALIALIEGLPIVFWEVFFLVPMGRGKDLPLISAVKFDEAIEKLHALSKRAKFILKVTEAPHYRMYCIEKDKRDGATLAEEKPVMPQYLKGQGVMGARGSIGLAPQGVNSGKGFVFVSYRGDVMPSGFLPIHTGNLRQESLSTIYRQSPILKQLRDTSLLKGKCGLCTYKDLCGGSRARAYAMSGDYLAEDPCCSYQP